MITPRVGCREWDSNLEAVVRGLYNFMIQNEPFSTFLNVPKLERQLKKGLFLVYDSFCGLNFIVSISFLKLVKYVGKDSESP